MIFRSSSHALASGMSTVSASRLCSSSTSTPRSRIFIMKSKWSRCAFCTHITSSKSRSSQLVGVRRLCARPGAQTTTLRNVPTSEWTPWVAARVSVMTCSLESDPSGGEGDHARHRPDDRDGEDDEFAWGEQLAPLLAPRHHEEHGRGGVDDEGHQEELRPGGHEQEQRVEGRDSRNGQLTSTTGRLLGVRLPAEAELERVAGCEHERDQAQRAGEV